jgi:hypothetical protein
MLGKDEGHCRRVPEPAKVVTICDHLAFLRRAKPKREIGREPGRVSFHLLIELLGRYAVEKRQIGIHHHPLTADDQDSRCDSLNGRHGLLPIDYLSHRG